MFLGLRQIRTGKECDIVGSSGRKDQDPLVSIAQRLRREFLQVFELRQEYIDLIRKNTVGEEQRNIEKGDIVDPQIKGHIFRVEGILPNNRLGLIVEILPVDQDGDTYSIDLDSSPRNAKIFFTTQFKDKNKKPEILKGMDAVGKIESWISFLK